MYMWGYIIDNICTQKYACILCIIYIDCTYRYAREFGLRNKPNLNRFWECVCVRISICRSAGKEKEIKEVINLRTHRLASCTGKRRSSAAVATQPIRQILLLLLLASASALLWTAAVTLAAALAPRLALGCSDIALQMRRLLILQSLKQPKKKLIIENRNKDTLCPILKTNSNTLTIFKVKTDVLYVILIKKYMYLIYVYLLCAICYASLCL